MTSKSAKPPPRQPASSSWAGGSNGEVTSGGNEGLDDDTIGTDNSVLFRWEKVVQDSSGGHDQLQVRIAPQGWKDPRVLRALSRDVEDRRV